MSLRLDRRDVLVALAAVGSGLAAPARAAGALQIDPEGAKRIGQAYIAGHAGLDAARLRAELLPHDWTPAAAASLRARVAGDFRAGRLFVHRGWRLSDTEGRLFALTALEA